MLIAMKAPTAPAMNRDYTIDLATLPAEEAEEIQRLVRQMDLAALANHLIGKASRPDAFYYRIVIEDQGGQYTIQASDADLPAALRPLVDWLTKRASPGTG